MARLANTLMVCGQLKIHVLHSPDRPEIVYSLRTGSHKKSLICKTSYLNHRNFLIKAIYKDKCKKTSVL